MAISYKATIENWVADFTDMSSNVRGFKIIKATGFGKSPKAAIKAADLNVERERKAVCNRDGNWEVIVHAVDVNNLAGREVYTTNAVFAKGRGVKGRK